VLPMFIAIAAGGNPVPLVGKHMPTGARPE
jgi:hypothetical protein